MDDMSKALAKILKEIRVSVGFTQQAVAAALEINRATYTYYELGRTKPDYPTLWKLSKIFNVPVAVFFEPEQFPRQDHGKRPKKQVKINPQKIGDLTADEKEWIARFRVKTGK